MILQCVDYNDLVVHVYMYIGTLTIMILFRFLQHSVSTWPQLCSYCFHTILFIWIHTCMYTFIIIVQRWLLIYMYCTCMVVSQLVSFYHAMFIYVYTIFVKPFKIFIYNANKWITVYCLIKLNTVYFNSRMKLTHITLVMGCEDCYMYKLLRMLYRLWLLILINWIALYRLWILIFQRLSLV